jgi:hypothetical protein
LSENNGTKMPRPSKNKFIKEHKALLEILARLSEQELRVIFKYFNKCGIDHIGTLIVNLVKFKNPNLTKENKNKLYKVLFENKNLVRYLINNNENKLEGKIKKLTTQEGGGLITALLSIGIPILVDIIASAAKKKKK